MKSQMSSVLHHEWKYFVALKRFRFSMLFLIVAPAIFTMLAYIYFGELNFYYPIIIMALGVPRITVNMISYSIGGEKVYKTFESLLSTPIRTESMFIGKSMIAILISLVMLVVSSLFTWLTANFIQFVFMHETSLIWFSTAQSILIFDNLLICIFMIFITGILSMVMQKPRQGLYIASALSFLTMVPSLLVTFGVKHPLEWSAGIMIILLEINLFLIYYVLQRIKRPQIMAKL